MFKTPILSYVILQLARQKELDTKDIYIQAMFQKSEKLIIKIDILQFENKELIRALKIEKQKRNKDKKLNLLSEKNNNPQLFFLLKI